MDGIEVKECKDPEWQKYIYINILLLESGKEGNELRTILRLR